MAQLMRFKAVVKTNCMDDPDGFYRVKVANKDVWPEMSEYIPSLNCLYLQEGDTVLVEFTSTLDPIIMGKLYDYGQKVTNPKEGRPVLFQAVRGSSWVAGVLTESGLEIETSGGNKITLEQKSLDVGVTESITIDAKTEVKISSSNNVVVDASDVTVHGSSLHLNGTVIDTNGAIAAASGSGPFCGLPSCLFSGAPHIGDTVTGGS